MRHPPGDSIQVFTQYGDEILVGIPLVQEYRQPVFRCKLQLPVKGPGLGIKPALL